MQPTLMGQALADRPDTCNLPRIPSGRYPAYSTTRTAVFDANGNATIEVEAERDLLFTTLTVVDPTIAGDNAVRFDATYCNTTYILHGDPRVWGRCCDRKPVFLVGVRENKSLFFKFSGGTPDSLASVTLSGFQGNGCCS
jgi:hypothetical protein